MGKTSRDTPKCSVLGRGQLMLDKKIPILEEVRNLLLYALFPTRRFLLSGRGGTTSAKLRHSGLQFPAYFGDRLENGPREFCYDMKLAHLMRHVAKDLDNGTGIKRGPVGGYALEVKPMSIQDGLETSKEPLDVFAGGIVVEHLVDQAMKRAVVHNGQYAEGTVV